MGGWAARRAKDSPSRKVGISAPGFRRGVTVSGVSYLSPNRM